ncbi:MAG: alkaline phosphatase, partial [Gemmatimonadaceae bacterium]|nr:alkaline phosphatase [Gemmatimonadaceae bacterium]
MRRLLAAATAAASLLVLAGCDDRTPAEPTADVALRRIGPSDPGFPGGFDLQVVGRYEGGGAGAAEITAYDDVSRRLFVVNGARGDVDVLDLRDPSRPVKVGTITPGLGAVNSVAAHDGLIALAIQATDKVSPGTVAFHSALTLRKISEVSVGALPDMLTFTPSGKQVVVANEGEPNADYSIDPEGSVSIIDVRNRNRPSVRTASFRRFVGREDALRARGIRIYGPNANAAQDFEPEYVAIDENERFAYVTLQENNAIATVDLRTATVLSVSPLGYKDHRRARNAFDPSDRDGGVNIRTWPVFGMYQPDAVAA